MDPTEEDLAVEASMAEARETAVRLNLQTAGKPDDEASIRRLAAETGVPLESAREQEAFLRNLQATREIIGTTRDRPVTQRFLADPDKAAIATDDVPTLTGIESIFQTIGDYARSVPAGALKGTGSGLKGAGDFFGVFDWAITALTGDDGRRDKETPAFGFTGGVNSSMQRPAADARGSAADQTLRTLAADPRAPLRNLPAGLSLSGQGVKFLGNEAGVPAERQTFGTNVAEGVGQIGGQALLSLVAPQTAALFFAGQGADQMGDKARDAGVFGTAEGYTAMAAGAAVTAGSEKLAIDNLLTRLPPAWKARVASRIADIGIAGVVEGAQEAAEGAAQNLLDKALLDPDAELTEGLAEQAATAGVAAGIVRIIVNAMTPGRGRPPPSEAQGEKTAGVLAELDKLAATSPLRERDPAAFEAFVAEVVADGVDSVYVDAKTFAQAAANATPEELAILEGMASMQGLVEAAETGQDLKIPVAEFAARLAGTSLAPVIIENGRRNPFELSRAQAKVAREVQGEALQAEAAKVLASAQADDAFRASAKVVEEQTLGQLTAVNRFSPDVNKAYAKAHAAFYVVQAARHNTTPEEMAQRYPLRITAEEAPGSNPLRQNLPTLKAPPTSPSGKVRLLHWGKKGKVARLDPKKWGGNQDVLSRAERMMADDDRHPGRVYFGIGVGQPGGYTPEFGLGEHLYGAEIDAKDLYDYDADPLGLRAGRVKEMLADEGFDAEPEEGMPDFGYYDEAALLYDLAIREAGYKGFWTAEQGSGLIGVSFEKVRAEYQGKNDGQAFYQRAVAKGDGRRFRDFFAGVTSGASGRPDKANDQRLVDLSEVADFSAEYNKHLGNFDKHIEASIPTFREVQHAVGAALVKALPDGSSMLDIAGSEGALAKAISAVSKGGIETVVLDPNQSMRETFANTSQVPGATFVMDAFTDTAADEGQTLWTEPALKGDGEIEIKGYTPSKPFTVVHEAMGFQFIHNDREAQVSRVKELLEEGGLAVFEEKFVPGNGLSPEQWKANEAKKDDFKRQFFSEADIAAKAKTVLQGETTDEEKVVGMNDLMVAPGDFENTLRGHFAFVVQFWDSGNFKGYMASDSAEMLSSVLENLIPLDSEFSTAPTPREVGAPVDRISTRQPSTKRAQEDALAEVLDVGIEPMARNEKVLAHNADLISTYPGFSSTATTPLGVVKDFAAFVESNLLWLFDRVPVATRERARLWYDGGNKLANRWGERYGVPPRGVAAVIASLSPQKDWYQNVSLAERILDITTHAADYVFDEQMTATAERIFGKPQYADAVASLKGKSLSEITNPVERAMWVRIYDEAHNPRGFRVTTPEGEFVGEAKGNVAWGSNVEIAKALEVLRDPSRENISRQMGTKHKVRSFYNNIIAPNAGSDVTIDTHAVAAGLVRPLSGGSPEVYHNFGLSPEKAKQPAGWRAAKNAADFGIEGTYGIYADAYRSAAAARGVLPREMQSVTWEAVRGLFEAKAKRAKGAQSLTGKVDAAWRAHEEGKATLDGTRNEIESLAGGVQPPSWEGLGAGVSGEAQAASYEGELVGRGVPRRAAGGLGDGSGNPAGAADVGTFAQSAPLATDELFPGYDAEHRQARFDKWFKRSVVREQPTSSRQDPMSLPPKVVYHGTNADIMTFESGRETTNSGTFGSWTTTRTGIFFAEDPKMAEGYVKRNDNGGGRTPFAEGGNVMPVYLSIQKPFDLTGETLDGWNAATTALAERGLSLSGIMAWNTTDRWEVFDGEEGALFKEALQSLGYDGVFMQENDDNGDAQDVWVVFEPAQVKSALGNRGSFDANDPNVMRQNGEDRGSFDPNTNTINLLRRADLSTFLHETGHFYLNVLADMASRPDAPAEVVADMETTLRWFGVPNLQTWLSMSLDEQRPHHEKWARGYEAFLFEGKAPNLGMRELFARFSAWMKLVYKSLTELNVELDDEVRGVFNRLLATSEEIAAAEDARSFLPIFQSKPEGMTDDEWVDYQRLGQQATADAASELQTRSLRDMKWLSNAKSRALRELQKGALAKRKNVRDEVTAEVQAEPVYRALAYLKRGEIDGVATADARKLSIPALKAANAGVAPELQDWTALGYGKYGMLAEDGMTPDEAAELFGFDSGGQLVDALLNAEPINDKIKGLTDQRMLERYGDLTDPATLARAAEQAVHNEARIRFVAAELNALAKGLGKPSILNAAVKEYAAGIIARLPIKELRPHRYTAAGLRAAKASEKALAKGNQVEALTEKRNQLINIQAARAAWDARAEVDKGMALFARIARAKDDNVARSRNMDLVNAARAIMAAYGLGRAKNDPLGYMQALKRYDVDLFNDIEPFVTSATANPKPVEQLTYEEFLGLRDTVNQLWTLARRSKVIEIDGKQVEIDTVTAELGQRLDVLGVPDRNLDRAPTDGERKLRQLSGLRAATRRVEHWAQLLGKPFTRYIWNPVADAADAYRAEKAVYMAKFLDLLKPIAPTLKPVKIAATEIGYTFSGKSELLHAILHTGNLSNKTKLLVGRKWGSLTPDGALNSARWEAFVTRMHDEKVLTKADWDFAQSVWNLLEETKPLAQRAHHTMYGRYFAEVTAEEVVTPFGNYAGGYVPALTDAFLVQDAALRAEAEAVEGGDHSMFPSPTKGFTKGRVENYNRELALDLRLLPQHIDKVLKFSHLGPPVRDVLRLLKAKGFSTKLEKFDPVAQGELLLPWLNRAVRQTVSTPMKGEAGRMADAFFKELRKRTGLQIMFGNIVNAIQQFTGFSVSLVKVKPTHLRAALWQYMRQPTEMAEAIASVSPFMAERMASQTFEINQAIDDIVLDPSKLDQTRAFFNRHGYFIQHAFQNVVDITTWQGAYDQAQAGGMNHAEAVREANAAVRQTQGAMNAEDLARVEAGNAVFRLFTQFSTYFNNMANLLGTEFAGTIRDAGFKGTPRLVYVYFTVFAVPALLSDLLVRAMRGEGDDEDDGWMDEFLDWFFGAQFRTLTAMIPVAGPAVQATVNTFNKKPYDDRIANSPALAALESAARAPKSVYAAATGDGSAKRAVKDTLTAVGLATGLPVAVIGKPVGYAIDVAEGKTKPTGPVDAARGAVSGTGPPHF